MAHWRSQRRRTGRHELDLRRATRAARRTEAVADAVRDLGPDVDHVRVADVTGVPLGYLRWAYPSVADLPGHTA
ncbi:hypothetical protein ABFT23_12240 [Nocardioides sp. C4-1]|uniref:hypothetical protein n=1 Tax=Nocardioides sp. C4-1 TaxID=3151851 RepID=UPI0032651381